MAVTLLFVFLAVAGLATGREFHLYNNLPYTVLVGILGNDGLEQPDNGGFILQPMDGRTVVVPDGWGGVFWARTRCTFDSSGHVKCATGDCGVNLECNGNAGDPPTTLFQVQLNGISGLDFYNISLVNGFNVPMRVIPNIAGGSGYWCTPVDCLVNLNTECPDDLKVLDGSNVVACKSSCLEYDTDETCCRDDYSDLESCKNGTSAEYFKTNCPKTYSYPFDDGTSTFTCFNVNYDVLFG